MDKPGFDAVARRLGAVRLSRGGALRGLGALALGALIGVEETRANGKKKPKTKPVCLCASADATTCRTTQIAAKKARNKAKAKCNYTGRCKPGVVATRCRCGSGGPCRVFATSSEHNGNLGGLAGADAICQGLAEAAGLPGTYKAWLSDSTGSPSTRFVRSPGPYVLVDGTTVANDWADLTTCDAAAPFACLAHAIDQTEQGITVSDRYVWTNTLTSGEAGSAGDDCEEWRSAADETGGAGFTSNTDLIWTTGSRSYCPYPFPLFCFQQS